MEDRELMSKKQEWQERFNEPDLEESKDYKRKKRAMSRNARRQGNDPDREEE